MTTPSVVQKVALLKELAWLVSRVRKDFINTPGGKESELENYNMRITLHECDLLEAELIEEIKKEPPTTLTPYQQNLELKVLELANNDASLKLQEAIKKKEQSYIPRDISLAIKKYTEANQAYGRALYRRYYTTFKDSPLYKARAQFFGPTPAPLTGAYFEVLLKILKSAKTKLSEIILPLLSVFTLHELRDIFNFPLPSVKNALAEARNSTWKNTQRFAGGFTAAGVACVATAVFASTSATLFFALMGPALLIAGLYTALMPYFERKYYDEHAKNTPNEAADVKSALGFEFVLSNDGEITCPAYNTAPKYYADPHEIDTTSSQSGVGATHFNAYGQGQEQGHTKTYNNPYVLNDDDDDDQQPLLRQGGNRG